MIQDNDDLEVSIKQCNEKSRNVFSCPILLALDAFQFNINFDVVARESKAVKLKIDVNNKCRYQSLPTSIFVELNIEKVFDIIPDNMSSKSSNLALVDKGKVVHVRHFYTLENLGPSNAEGAEVFIGVKRQNLTISYKDIIIEDRFCSFILFVFDVIFGRPKQKEDVQLFPSQKVQGMCSVEENCIFLKCTRKLEKKSVKELKITMNVKDDAIDEEHGNLESVLRTFSSSGKNTTVVQTTVLRLRNYDLGVTGCPMKNTP